MPRAPLGTGVTRCTAPHAESLNSLLITIDNPPHTLKYRKSLKSSLEVFENIFTDEAILVFSAVKIQQPPIYLFF